ncbi:MAG: hypothetical protein K6E59_06580 [Bacilli bacterium]|nr:hypothetical protein [Bacilli bacterium]
MRVFSFAKHLRKKKGKGSSIARLGALTFLAIGNLFGVFVGTFAWFQIAKENVSLETVSGSLGVEIENVTVHKYVYPKFRQDSDIINYEGAGSIKSYVVEDASFREEYPDEPAAANASISMGLGSFRRYSVDLEEAHTSELFYYDESSAGRYFLIGNDIFNACSDAPWCSFSGIAFPGSQDTGASLRDVVISEGSEFLFIDASVASGNIHKSTDEARCFLFNSLTPSSRFVIEEDGRILKCIRSGTYNITYSYIEGTRALSIDLSNASAEEAIISNNILDPTMIKISYLTLPAAERAAKTQAQYMPEAIKSQNTMVIFEAKIHYDLASLSQARLSIVRSGQTAAKSIYGIPGKYEAPYSANETETPFRSSDFYSFSAYFSSVRIGSGDPEAIWEAMHGEDSDSVTPYAKSKFANGDSYDTSLDCPLQGASTLLQPNLAGTDMYCYVAVDYDPASCLFFMNEDRLGKTYLFERDFTMYFAAEQITSDSPLWSE